MARQKKTENKKKSNGASLIIPLTGLSMGSRQGKLPNKSQDKSRYKSQGKSVPK